MAVSDVIRGRLRKPGMALTPHGYLVLRAYLRQNRAARRKSGSLVMPSV